MRFTQLFLSEFCRSTQIFSARNIISIMRMCRNIHLIDKIKTRRHIVFFNCAITIELKSIEIINCC